MYTALFLQALNIPQLRFDTWSLDLAMNFKHFLFLKGLRRLMKLSLNFAKQRRRKIRQMGVGKQKKAEKSPLEKGKYLKMRTNAHLFLLHGNLYDKYKKIQFY